MAQAEKAVFDGVQAALLDSECDPETAVKKALEAVAQFAVSEGITSDRSDWEEFCEEAWENYPPPP